MDKTKYTLSKTLTFDTAHRLYKYKGKCSQLHGHTYHVTLIISGEKLNQQGMLLDFGDIKKMLKAVTGELDHSIIFSKDDPVGKAILLIEDTLKEKLGIIFMEDNPTAENMAKMIYDKLRKQISKEYELKIELMETPTSKAMCG